MKFASLLILASCIGYLPSYEGKKTERKKKSIYTFLLTEDVSFGLLGRIDSQYFCQTRFRCTGYQKYISVDYFTGTLKLSKNPLYLSKRWNGIRRFASKILVKNVCGTSTTFFYVTVKLVVFPYKFGDAFLRTYNWKKMKNVVHENRKFDDGVGVANSFHRMMRTVTKDENPEAVDEMMASVKVDTALEGALNKIVKKHVTINPDEQVVYRWSLNSLFSREALRNLAHKLGCKQENVSPCSINAEYRTFDGTCNNINNPLFGSAPIALTRFVPAKYYDAEGLNDPIGFPHQSNVPDIPATFKVVQEFIAQQEEPERFSTKFSHAVMQFGQFLDHDLDLSPEIENSDRCMKTKCDGSQEDFSVPCYTILPLHPCFNCIHFSRSATECQIQNGQIKKREQININTAFVDGSQVYGSSIVTAKRLRNLNSKGFLRISNSGHGALLPVDEKIPTGQNKLCREIGVCYFAGDTRSNEQMVLAATHTLFVREHNRIALALGKLNPNWNGEKIYQETRKIVGAVLQKITYEDFLPIIIGKTLPRYRGYNSNINPGILNSFATAAFRFGHSLIRPTFDRLDKGFNPTGKPLLLRHLFFNNTFIQKFGIDELLLGLLANESQTVDRELAVGLLNHLFERPQMGSPGLNLAALNIQRSRDHGLPGYNAFRRKCGLKNAKSFSDTSNEIQSPQNRKLLSQLYGDDPNLADLWVAGLAEAPANGGIVGATFGCIIQEQMKRVRDGDRFFYMNTGVFSSEQLKEIQKMTLSKIMCNNLNNIVSVQRNAFLAGSQKIHRISCDQILGIDLRAWKEKACTMKTTAGQCCVFPFRYKYKWYHSCTTVDNWPRLWCATTSNYDTDKKWGNCQGTQNCCNT